MLGYFIALVVVTFPSSNLVHLTKKVLIEMKIHISIKIFKCSSTTQRVSLVELLAEICDVM